SLHGRLGKHTGELVAAELFQRRIAEGVRAPIAMLVGDNEVEMPAVAQRPVGLEAVDGRQVVRLQPQPVAIELFDRSVFYRWWIEALERPVPRSDACGEIFEPGLIRRDLDALARLLERPRLDDALPALPREFVVVPHRDKRPARARVLEVGIGEIAFVDGALTIDGRRDVEVADLVAIRDARDLVERAVVACLHLVGIFDHLVDEIAEVQNETELLGGGSAFIFVDHSAIGVELAFIDILTAHEREAHRAGIVWQRRRDRAADTAAVSVAVGESIPVGARRLESADENARGPIRGAEDSCRCVRNDSPECLILGYLDGQALACAVGERTPRPQNDAVRVGIPSGDALRIQITPLMPSDTRTAGRSA